MILAKMGVPCTSSQIAVELEFRDRMRLLDETQSLIQEFKLLTAPNATGDADACRTLMTSISSLHTKWNQVRNATILNSDNYHFKTVVVFIGQTLRTRSLGGVCLRFLKGFCKSQSEEVASTAITVGKELSAILPKAVEYLIGVFSDWQSLIILKTKISGAKVLGPIELAKGGQIAAEFRDRRVKCGIDEFRGEQDALTTVSIACNKGLDVFILKNKCLTAEQFDATVLKYNDILTMVQSWDFSECKWFNKDAPESINTDLKNIQTSIIAGSKANLIVLDELVTLTAWNDNLYDASSNETYYARLKKMQADFKTMGEMANAREILACMVLTKCLLEEDVTKPVLQDSINVVTSHCKMDRLENIHIHIYIYTYYIMSGSATIFVFCIHGLCWVLYICLSHRGSVGASRRSLGGSLPCRSQGSLGTPRGLSGIGASWGVDNPKVPKLQSRK